MARHRLETRRRGGFGQQAVWWVVSFVLHLGLLFALSFIQFAVPPKPKEIAEITTEFVEIMERIRPLKKRDVFSDKKQTSQTAASWQSQASVLSKAVPTMTVGKRDVGNMIGDLFKGGAEDAFATFGGGADLAAVQSAAPQTYDEVLDAFAEELIEATGKRKRILVVLLLDESKSIFDDRKSISAKIDSILETLNKEMSDQERKRLKWAVVSYGKHARIALPPTEDLKRVKAKLMRIPFDTTGVENLLGAIRYTLKSFYSKKWNLYISVVSDEPGDDCKGDKGGKLLDVTLGQLKATKTRLFCFGSEANFSFPRVWAPVYDEDGRVVDYNWADGGPESVEGELLPFDWRFNDRARSIPSGFGMYSQTYLSQQSGGVYFILSDAPSRYDEDKLDKYYAPEIVPRAIYLQRRAQSDVRKKVYFVTQEWYRKYRVSGWFTRLDPAKLREDALARIMVAQKGHVFCRDAIRALQKVRKADKWRPKRWDANRDLTVAQLAKIQFLYRQYWLAVGEAVKKGWPYPKKGERYTHFDVRFTGRTEKPPGGRAARAEMRKAEMLLKQVAKDHEGTPWAELATRDLDRLRPFTTHFGYYERRERQKL